MRLIQMCSTRMSGSYHLPPASVLPVCGGSCVVSYSYIAYLVLSTEGVAVVFE